MKSAATMKLRTSDPSIMELQNCSSHTLSRPNTCTRYIVVTWGTAHVPVRSHGSNNRFPVGWMLEVLVLVGSRTCVEVKKSPQSRVKMTRAWTSRMNWLNCHVRQKQNVVTYINHTSTFCRGKHTHTHSGIRRLNCSRLIVSLPVWMKTLGKIIWGWEFFCYWNHSEYYQRWSHLTRYGGKVKMKPDFIEMIM